MQYSRLGNTGLVVSRLAFGAMTFGPAQGVFAPVSKVEDQTLADSLVEKALDAGINHFNTADFYTEGHSEEMLGKALRHRRKDVVISTKCGFRTGSGLLQQGLSRQHILAAAEASLRRLGTDYIDVYLAHRLDPFTPIEETVEALDTLARTGKVRYVGFSNWNAWIAAKAVGIQRGRDYAPFRAAELYYSLIGRDVEQELAPFVEDAGIGVFAWSPLAGGWLTGKYTRENPKGDGGRAGNIDFLPMKPEQVYDLIERLCGMGKAHNASPAQVALAWILSKKFVSSILLGANKLAQLEDNLGAVNVQLSPEEMTELDSLTATPLPYPNWFKPLTNDTAIQQALTWKAAAA
jgi:aryl-alcohol dehydrogenase-like predicted oxidoreductase